MMTVQAPPSLHHDPPVIASGIKKNHPNGILYQYSSDHTHVAKSDLVCDIVAPERGLAVIPGPSLFKCCIRRHLPRLSETGKSHQARVQRERKCKLCSVKSVS